MATKIVNLTQQNVNRKIKETLKQNSDCEDSQAFTNSELQQKLTTYVLKRVHNCYVAVEPGQETTLEGMINAELQCHQLDGLIRQGMDVLLRTVKRHMLRTIDSSYHDTEPSHWFG
ncbi:MAG: hypothetical protein F6J95_030415 [Leptolyngbya sp. SIO1E4]|nr:hypothetical protein [Leptolyngbya sp. SIO1E4]